MPDSVVLTIPATSAYVVLARTAAAAMAARLDFPVERIDDLRLAVDEAAALLLADPAPHAEICCTFTAYDDALEVELASPGSQAVDRATFAWTVLSALVDRVTDDVAGGMLRITMSCTRSGAPS